MAPTKRFQEPKSFIFFFNELPLQELDPEELLKDQPENKNDTGILAATCMVPLRSVLMSDLNSCGYVQAIYINFGATRGYYKFNPRLIVAAEHEPFTDMLDRFFEHEEIRDAESNNIVLSEKITDPSLLLADLHATSRIVGCLDGNESVVATPINEYLENASPSTEQPIIFVVGQILRHEIESHIHDYVRVSESKLETHSQLTSVIDTVEGILFG